MYKRAAALFLVLALAACDRNIEPFDPDEKPRQPDLSRIFPEGAEVAAQESVELPEPPGRRGAPPVAAGAPIQGTVALAPGLEGRVPASGVLFLIARSGAGGPPLAVKRIEQPTFPLEFSLGPDDRMIQSLPFEGPLVLTARVDADGNATTRSPGDLQGRADSPVSPGTRGISLLIDEAL